MDAIPRICCKIQLLLEQNVLTIVKITVYVRLYANLKVSHGSMCILTRWANFIFALTFIFIVIDLPNQTVLGSLETEK